MKTLLLVEDDSLLAATEGHWLKKAGYNVIHSPTGENAIHIVKEQSRRIDLILMDINLGSGMDGTAAAREILRDHDIPILFLSSHTEKEVVEKTEEITSYGYVVKAAKDVVLLASIRMAFKLFEANRSLKIKDEALEKSQERLRRAEFISGAGNWELHLGTGRIIGSEGAAKVYGISFTDNDLSEIQNMVLPEYRAELDSALKNLIERGIPYNVTFKIKRAGSGEIVDIRSTAEYDKEEGIVFGVIKDITKRKMAEDAIKYERNLLRLLIDNLPHPVFFKDSQGLYLLNNKAHLESMGVKSQLDVVGKTPLDFYEPELGAEFHKEELEIIRTGKSIKNKEEKIIHSVTGEEMWHLANKIPIIDEEGKVSGIVGIISDITKQKKEEQAIIESEHRWRSAIEGNNQGLWDWNLETNEVYYSPLWKKMLGYEENDILPHLDSWSKLVHPDDHPKIMEKLKKNLRGESRSYSSEHRVKCKDGSYKWILDQGNVLSFDENGKPLRMIGTHKDISERKKIEEGLRKFRISIDRSADAIFITDKNGVIEYVNKAFENVYGYSSEEAIGETPRLIKSGILPEEVYAEFWSNLISNKSVTREIQNKRKDGHIITVEGSNNPVVNDQGEIIGFLAIHRDISERKRDEALQKIVFNVSTAVITTKNIEELLSIIRDQLGSLMDTTNFYVAFYDKNTDTLSTPFVRDEKDEISTWPAEKSATGLVIKNQKTTVIKRDDITKLADEGIIEVIGTPSAIWVGVPLKVEDEVIGAIVVQDYHDEDAFDSKTIEILEFLSSQLGISIQRKQIETELQKKQNVLAEAQRIAQIGSWDADIKTRNISWSDEMYRIFGVSRENFVPTAGAILRLIHEDDRKLFLNSIQKQSAGHEELGLEFRIKIKDGLIKYLRLTGVPTFDENGAAVGSIGAVQNITERKLSEFQLHKYMEELKSINATKDKFFSIISHDLKNPFHSINSAIRLLISEESNLTSDEKKIFLSGILNASGKAYSLLENLLIWSRNQSGQIEYFPETISLSELSSSSVEFVKNSAALKNIIINNHVENGIYARADWNMLQTVMRNLLTNAIKFTDEYGRIDITATTEDHTIEVNVSDSGVGIHPDNIKRLFRIDKQYTTQGTKSESGSGLGLILCKDFVERNGGKLKVESKIGSGSKFSFTLPLNTDR